VEADLLSGGRKRSRRERIRERILKKTDKPEKPTAKEVKRDEDLNDFLKSPPEGDFLPRFPSPSRKSVPRINVALSPRRPDAQDVAIEDGTGHLAKDQLDALPDCPPWRSRRKGLTVRFAVTAPQIIGEGGEEAEAPSIWISQTRQSRSAPTSAHDEPHQTHAASVSTPANPRVVASNAVIAPAGEDFEPRILVRAPTGFGEARVGLDASTTTRNMKDAEFEPTVAGVDSTQPAVQSHSGLLSASAAGLKRKMLEEEARAFTSALRDPSPEPSSLQKNMTPPSKSQENLPAASTASYAQRGHSPSVSSNHLSPQGQSPSPSRPSSSSSHGSSHHATPPIAASPKRKPLPKPPTAESKEDALTGFRSRARCYYPLFVLAAEKTDPGLDAPLSRWMRAAAWWFLTAETNFKLLRKDLEEGANVLQITASRRHMQAVVDLAKTAWIVEDVVRDYAKADALDMSTPESIVRLIQSNPLSRFSRTLQYWQDLLKRFASLVAAIRRNGFMTSATEHVPLSAGIDTSIWLTSPISDPGTAHWLRCANPPWVRMDRTMTPVEPSDLSKVVPLKSTTNTFRIRSMFCQASGGFQDHDRTPTVPCILTIARRSGSYALVLFVASQDHGINVVLETDPVRGDGIEWQQTNSSVLFNFADGFRFLVRFQLADYIHFKDCYDLALRALNATVRDSPENANLGEKLIFRATSCAFERRSSEKIHSFPYEGEQKDCEIILFEKYEAVRGTSTTRKAHRGLRLSVMLSPQAGNLGILDVHLGGDKPILFHSAHEYSPPVVELMDSRRALLIIKFSRHRDFNRFYELLISLDHSINENTHYEQVPLRSFSVEPSSSEARTFLSGAPWGDVQVTMGKDLGHQPNHTTNTVRFASINICASSIQAVFAERLVEGVYASVKVLTSFSY